MPPIQIKREVTIRVTVDKRHVIFRQASSFFLVLSLFCDICIASLKAHRESITFKIIDYPDYFGLFLLAYSSLLFISP